MSSRSPIRRGGAALAAAAVLAAAPAPASSAPIEQVSRATGPQGAAVFTTYGQPLAVSNDGRQATFIDRDYRRAQVPIVVRDIVANTTTTIGMLPRDAQVLGVDKAQTKLLVREGQTVLLRSFAGTALRTIATFDPEAYDASAALSANGKVVVVSDGENTLTFRNADTGAAVRTISYDDKLKLSSQAISDDGSVVAGELGSAFGFYATADGTVHPIGSPGVVSGDGSAVVSVGPFPGDPTVITATADGSSREFAAPTTSYNFPLWVAPDASRVVSGSFSVLGGSANVLQVSTGKWSKFGAAVSASLTGDLVRSSGPRTVLSPNLKYALFPYGGYVSGQLAIADTAGGDLPGVQEAISASSYLQVTPPFVANCDPSATSEIGVLFQRPGTWVPKPLVAWLRVSVDGKLVLNRSLTKAYDLSIYPNPQQPNGISIPFPSTAKQIGISVTTLDVNGRFLTSREVTKPYSFCGA